MGIESILHIFPIVQLKLAAKNLNHFSVNSFWCFILYILMSRRISLAKVLYLPCELNYLGPRTHMFHCLWIVLHSCTLKEISTSFSSIYSLGCDFMVALSQQKWSLSHLTLAIHSQFSFFATSTIHPDVQWTGSVKWSAWKPVQK